MTPIYLNSSSNNCSSYASDQHSEDHLCSHQFLSPNSQASSSSTSLTTHLFLNSTINHDQHGVFRSESQPPQRQHQGDNFGSQAYNNCPIDSNHEKDLNFSIWKNKADMNSDHNQVKWMSSKMRVMLKMKKSDPTKPSTSSATTTQVKIEDHKLPTSSPMEETDNSSNGTSSNNTMPIRVCSDCNTTKTPLWRSGPRGPKSLCNACGIRQRKARRAMAAAAAANGNSTNVHNDKSIMAPLKLKKIQHKVHKRPSNGHVTKYKKRQYSKQTTAIISPSPSSSSPTRKNCVEEFLVSLSKNLALYRLFPQDEKEAAILLMALSCGYAQET